MFSKYLLECMSYETLLRMNAAVDNHVRSLSVQSRSEICSAMILFLSEWHTESCPSH